MVEVIAKKRIGRKKPGETVRMTKVEARAVVALGMAEYKTRVLTAAVVANPTEAVKKPAKEAAAKYQTRAIKAD